LDAAVSVARRDSAELIGLAIEAHLPHYGATVGEVEEERRFEEQACTQLLEEASSYAAGRGVAMQADIRAGHPAQEIVRAADDQGADLIVVGHSGHAGVWGRFLGGTAEKVSRHAACSVLIVR
jgi:nucleotide-binding universal stress UspA family protein